MIDYSKQKTPPPSVIRSKTSTPWTTPPRPPEPEQGTVIETAPEGWTARREPPQVTTTAKNGTTVRYRGEVVGEARDGAVLLDVDSPVATAAHTAIRDGRVTKLVKGELQ